MLLFFFNIFWLAYYLNKSPNTEFWVGCCPRRFGRLQDQLEPIARYLIAETLPSGRTQWKAVQHTEYKRLHPRAAMRSGVCEVFAQSAQVVWSNGSDTTKHLFTFAPQILERGNGSTIYSAVEEASETLSLPSIREIAEKVPVVLYDEVVDSGKANVRKRMKTAEELDPCKNVLYQFSSGCAVHDTNRGLGRAVNEDGLVGHVHAVQHVLSMSSRRNALMATMKRMLVDELDIIQAEPPAAFREHAGQVVQHTIMRTLQQLRGSLHDGWELKPGLHKPR